MEQLMAIDGQTHRLHTTAMHRTRRLTLIRRIAVAIAVFTSVLGLATTAHLMQSEQESADVVIVGAGIAGLSAALEAATAGASVLVVDMSTVGGGHAILSNGAVCMIGTEL